MRALIAGGGSYYSEGMFAISEPYDVVIAVDRGIHLLESLKIEPNYFFGDMDSNTVYDNVGMINRLYDKKLTVEKLNPDKDFTDLDYSLHRAADLGVTEVTIIGGIGSRFDHSFTNINLLEKYKNDFKLIEITDGNNLILPLVSPMIIKDKKSKTVSIIPNKNMKSLSLHGFMYDLDKVDVNRMSSLLSSNVVTSDRATIDFVDGSGIVVFVDERL